VHVETCLAVVDGGMLGERRPALRLTGVLMEKVWARAEAASATGTRSLENIILSEVGLGVGVRVDVGVGVRWVVSGLELSWEDE
jgi:hypothetical protein